MPDETKYDLDYRPASYWELDDPVTATLNRIQGEGRRQMVRAALESGEAVPEDVLESKLSEEGLHAISAIHPSMMGGEYLPEMRAGEVEIARVVLDSATRDVISVRARPDGEWIRFRVVDEYYTEGSWYRLPIWKRREPLTMREVTRILDETKHILKGEELVVGLVLGWGDFYFDQYPTRRTAEEYRDFATVSSDFYPQLADWCDELSEEWCRERLADIGEEAEEDTTRAERHETVYPTSTLTDRLHREDPGPHLHLTDPPMTEREAIERVRRLQREGGLPSPAQVQEAAERIVAELKAEAGDARPGNQDPTEKKETTS